jgi:mannose-1-phosphate guanylyltransferase
MRAIVLVGGFGTRLRPLTYDRPKQMLPLAHRTMLEVVISRLGREGVTEAILSLGYQPDAFMRAFPSGEIDGVRLTYAVEPEPLDTGGAIGFAGRHAGIDDTFLVMNGDVLGDLSIGDLVAFHRSSGAEGTVHLIDVDDPSAFGVAVVDADGRVERFVEKPPRGTAPSHSINAGTYVLEPSVLDRISAGVPDRKVSIERQTFPQMVADRTLAAVSIPGYWMDLGKPVPYLRANLDAAAGIGPAAWGDPPAVHDTARMVGEAEHSLIGAGATVAAGAVVRGSLLLPGAFVDAGALVTDSIIGEGAAVGPGAEVIGTVIGDGARVDGRLRAVT